MPCHAQCPTMVSNLSLILSQVATYANQLVARRWARMRSQLPADAVPVYGHKEHMKGVDVELLNRALKEMVRASTVCSCMCT